MTRPLAQLRVVDLSSWIAGGYCTRLLADAGAQVTKVEAQPDPLRQWSASGASIAAGTDGALYNYLHVGHDHADADGLDALLADAHVVVWSRGSLRSPSDLLDRHPHLVVTSITPFGLEGPWADKPATEFTVQAWSGGIIGLARGNPQTPPVHVGGQVGEWVAGVYAAIGTLASWRRGGGQQGCGEIVDVSMLETSALSLTYYPVTFADQLGRPMRRKRFVPTPGVAFTQDGVVGLGVGTGQQWLDFAAMAGHPEWGEDPKLFLDRTGIAHELNGWIAGHTTEEMCELATALRIPNAPIVNGANALTYPHFGERESFQPNAIDGALNPRPPYRITTASGGEQRARVQLRLPFEGLRVLDMTAYWAGPLVGHLLAMLGAEVIHLESPSRPDGVRLVGGVPQTEEQYWERGPIFAALNSNKKSLTLDLSKPEGQELVRKVVATCDVVVENFTPRVLEQLGLEYDTLRQDRPDLVMVRMPGFGLDGPWRELAAFAFVIEDASGLTWLTGHPDEPPIEPYCVGDPNAGLHALLALILAVEHRDQTGEGSLVEAAMVDAALSIAAEQVIEQSAYGALLTRAGNRGPVSSPQGLYRPLLDESVRDEQWVAIAVADDEQWRGLCSIDERLAKLDRFADLDEVDGILGEWCAQRSTGGIVDQLWAAGVPVGKVMQPHLQPELEQLQSRGFFETLEHPVAGPARYSTVPMRFSRGPETFHTRHAPLLGEHSAQLLAELGLSDAEIAVLEESGVTGCRLQAR
jgi:crotonobetainyl-CoA:carnitine CoA-transferase CaiB-like acyl-CoA transferase